MMTINRHISFDGVSKCLSDLKEQFEEVCKDKFNKINPKGKREYVQPHNILINNPPSLYDKVMLYTCL